MIRRLLYLLPILALLAMVTMAQLPTPIASTVTVNTNGVVIAPANFWTANSNLMTVAAAPARGAVTNIRWNDGHFVVSGTNVSLAATWLLTNDWTVDFQATNSLDLDDADTITVDGMDTGIGGVRTLYLDGGITTLRGVTNLQLITPGVLVGTAIPNQVLTLVDAVEGTVEFGDLPNLGNYLPLTGGTMVGELNMGGQRIATLATPTFAGDATTKLYVDQRLNTIETVTFAAAGATNVNNLNPGSTTAVRVFVTRTLSIQDITITGIVAPEYSNRLLILVNGNAGSMQLVNASSSSTAANRFSFTADGAGASRNLTIGPWDAALLFYEPGATPRWRYLGTLSQGNNSLIQTSPAGVSVDALNRVTCGGPFERLVSAGFPFYGIEEWSSTTTTAVRMVELFNQTGGSVTIHHNSMGGGTPQMGILTPTGSGVTWPNLTGARFVYDKSTNRWRLLNGSF